MTFIRQTLLACSAIVAGQLFSGQLLASPWIDANDLYLRSHIQQLADAGIINAPVTSYPLMWNAINDDLLAVDQTLLSAKLTDSYAQVLHYYHRAVGNQFNHRAKISLANDVKRLNNFGDASHQKNQLQLSTEQIGRFWAAQFSMQLRDSPQSGQHLTFDNSYLAATYGNWVVRAGAISQWWGPGWDSSLILSNNARPLPALSLSRSNSDAFATPWLSWVGPWTFTAQMAKLESARHIANPLLWSARASARPIAQLDIGLNWSIQWGGNGQPNSLNDFFDAVTSQPQCANGASSCDSALHTKLGNQLAGIDLRWSDSIAGLPFAVYAQTIGEDAVNYLKPTDKAYVFGVDTVVTWDKQLFRLYLEYTDTQVSCYESPDLQSCYYEHKDIYRTGYRYHRRALGTTYDNDAQVWSVGVISQQANNHQWHSKLRFAQLNSDNHDVAPGSSLIGNQVSKIAEDLTQLDIQYQLPLCNGLLSLGADISHSSYIQQSSNNDFNANLSWEYRY